MVIFHSFLLVYQRVDWLDLWRKEFQESQSPKVSFKHKWKAVRAQCHFFIFQIRHGCLWVHREWKCELCTHACQCLMLQISHTDAWLHHFTLIIFNHLSLVHFLGRDKCSVCVPQNITAPSRNGLRMYHFTQPKISVRKAKSGMDFNHQTRNMGQTITNHPPNHHK